ncbi:MAG: hypothetical protein ABIR70_08470 [Bryobacteraceae bacterium]
MPSFEIERIGDLQEDSGGSEFDLALADDQTLYAVSRTDNSYLKCSRYRLYPSGSISPQASEQLSPQAANICVTSPGTGNAFTCCTKYADSRLLVTEWHPGPSADAEGAEGTHAAITSFAPEITVIPPGAEGPGKNTSSKFPNGQVFVTAHTTSGAQQLKVSAWLSGNVIGVQQLVSATDSKRHTQIAIAAHKVDEQEQVLTFITATRSDGYKLRLANWRLTLTKSQEPTLERISEALTDDTISEVSATVFSRATGDCVATAIVREGKLVLITWKIGADGSLTRWLEATAGAAAGIDVVNLRSTDIAVACRDSSDKLRVIYWRFPVNNSDPQVVVRMGTATAGRLDNQSAVAIAHTKSTVQKPGDSVVACKTSAGKMKLIRFRLSRGE